MFPDCSLNVPLQVPDEIVFMNLLEAFTLRLGQKFRVPTFCHTPLNMHKVFAEVQSRGGYNAVSHIWAHLGTLGYIWAERETLKGGLRCWSPRWAVGEKHSEGDLKGWSTVLVTALGSWAKHREGTLKCCLRC
jgi:hypothetical protein